MLLVVLGGARLSARTQLVISGVELVILLVFAVVALVRGSAPVKAPEPDPASRTPSTGPGSASNTSTASPASPPVR